MTLPVVWLARRFGSHYSTLARRMQDQQGDLATAAEEAASGIRVTKAFGRGPHLHEQFVAWVRQRRSDKLRGEDDELFSGEVWTGATAAELGLVDGLGTTREVLGKRFPDADVVVAEPRRPLLTRLGLAGGSTGMRAGLSAESVMAAVEAIDQRSTWSRFGL